MQIKASNDRLLGKITEQAAQIAGYFSAFKFFLLVHTLTVFVWNKPKAKASVKLLPVLQE